MKKLLQTFTLLAVMLLPWAAKAQDTCDNYYVATSSLPWSEDFEGVAEEGIPACWEQVQMCNEANPCVNRLSTYAHNSVALLSMWANNGGTNIIALPQFEDLTGLQITFFARQTGAYTVFCVGVIDDQGDFVGMDTIALSDMPSYPMAFGEYTFDLTEYANYGNRPAFKNIAGCVHIDDVTVSVIPSCLPPVSLELRDIATDEATLRFDYGAEEYAWQMVLSTTQLSNPGLSDDIAMLYDTVEYLTGLTANTLYYVYLRSDCTVDGYSEWTSTSFRTACEALTSEQLPYAESFDHYDLDWPPCWSRIMDPNDAFPYLWSNTAVSGMSLYMYGYYGDCYAILPPLDEEVDITTLQLRFWARQPSPIEVGVMTDPTDGTTFQLVGTVTPSGYDFEELEVLLSNYQGSGRYIALHPGSTGNSFIDNLTLELAPECSRPAVAEVLGVTANTALLSWTSVPGATGYTLAWGSQNDPSAATGSAALTDYDTSYTIAGLNANSTYYAWVSTLCEGSAQSNQTAFGAIETPCDFAPVPFSENFDSLPGDGNLAFPACWEQVSGLGTYSNPCPNVDATYAHSGTTSVSMYHYNYSWNRTENIFALPPFDNLQSLELSFWAYKWNDYAVTEFQVGVMEGSTFVPVETIDLTTSYAEYTVYFAGYQGYGNQPAFRGYNASGELRVNIDDINVDVASDCPRPSALHLDSATTTDLYLSWAQAGTSATSWSLYYDTAAVSDPANLYPMDYAGTTDYTISGLEANTVYYVYVQNDCNEQWIGPVQMRTAMCDGMCEVELVMHDSYGDSWNGASIEVVQSGMVMGTGTVGSGSLATEHVAICPNIAVNFNWHSGSYDNECGFEINDPWGHELYAQVDHTTNPSGTVFTYVTDCNPPTCTAASGLYVSDVDSVSAWLHWVDSLNYAWDIEFGPAGFTLGQGTQLSAYEDSIQLLGLSPNTLYEAYVIVDCGDGSSQTSRPITFRSGCGVISALPYVENFDSYSDGEVPPCWEQINITSSWSSATPCVYAYSYYAHSGNNSLYFYSDAPNSLSTIATPYFPDLDQLQLSFWVFSNSYYGTPTLVLGAVSDSNTFTGIDTLAVPTSYTQYTYYLNGYGQYGRRIGFRVIAPDSYIYTYLEDINIDLIPDCIPISNLTYNEANSTMTSVEVSWTDANNTQWEYIFDTVAISNDALYTPTATSSTTLTIGGLATGHNYYVYVRPVCSGVTPWTMVQAHTTLCDDFCALELVAGGYSWGWEDGASVEVRQNGITLATTGNTLGTTLVYVCPNIPIQFHYNSSAYSYEDSYCNVDINDAWGNNLYHQEGMGGVSNPFFTLTTDCQAPTCVAPRHLTAAAQPNSAMITWFDTMATDWTVMWSTSPFNPQTATGLSSAVSQTASYSITGLQPQTTYYVSVRANCTDTTIWSEQISFTTDCGYITSLPWTESFEGLTQPWQNAPLGLPQCWDIYQNYVSVNPCPFGGYAYQGQACVSVHGVGVGSCNHFALPAVEDLTGLYFSWMGIMQDAQAAGDPNTVHATVFSIGVMSDSTGEYIPMDTIVMGNKYQYYQVDLTPYAQYGHRIAVYARLDTTGNFHIYMDDFIIDSIHPCPNVANLDGRGLSTSSARLFWDVMDSTINPASYTIEYGLEGFTQGTGTIVNVNTNPCVINGLQPNTNYEYYVRANCIGGGQGAWSWFPGHFATECGVVSISYWEPLFESFESTSTIVPTCWSETHLGNASPDRNSEGVVDGTYCIQLGRNTTTYLVTPELDAAGDMTLSFYYRVRESWSAKALTVGYSLSSDDPTDSTWVWLDTLGVNTTSWTRRCDTIPMSARWVAFSAGDANNDLFLDSILFFTDVAGCSRPRNLHVVDTTATTAIVAWTGAGDEYQIELRNGATWGTNYMPVNTDTYTFTGLNPQTTYYYRVRQVCDVALFSEWAYGEFTTSDVIDINCVTPTDLTVLEVGYNSASLTWTAGGEETEWQVRYAGQGDTNTLRLSETNATITGLRNPADYTVWVRALCGMTGDVASEWSEPVTFSTTPCDTVTDIRFSNITAHGVTISWTSDAVQWRLDYGEAGHPIGTGTVVIVDEPTCTITNLLDAETSYDVFIQAICGEGWTSTMVRSSAFTTTVSIDQVQTSAISLYPNPASDIVTIEGYEGEAVVVDMTGRVVLTTTESTIDVRTLAKGAYFVKLGTQVKKLIVK